MGLKERIIKFIDYKELNPSNFEKKCGLSNGSVSKMGDNTSTRTIDLISKSFPELNTVWLRTGIGEMLKEKQDKETIIGIEKIQETRPHIPISAVAGRLCEYYAQIKESDCERYPLIAGLPDYSFTIPVTGNSMIPEYRSGDTVACRHIDHEEFLQWGKAYIIDTSQGIVFKKVMPTKDDENSILCVSFNSEEFPAYKLEKKYIYSMALVVGLARRD